MGCVFGIRGVYLVFGMCIWYLGMCIKYLGVYNWYFQVCILYLEVCICSSGCVFVISGVCIWYLFQLIINICLQSSRGRLPYWLIDDDVGLLKSLMIFSDIAASVSLVKSLVPSQSNRPFIQLVLLSQLVPIYVAAYLV